MKKNYKKNKGLPFSNSNGVMEVVKSSLFIFCNIEIYTIHLLYIATYEPMVSTLQYLL